MDRQELVNYFIERTDERFDKLEAKIEQLISFRWMLIGASCAVSSIISIIIAIYFGK